MPACTDKELLLCALVDGELDAANAALLEAHVVDCSDCREEYERLRAVAALTRSEGVRHRAPDALVRRVSELPELSPERSSRSWLPGWLAPGVAGALAATLAFVAFVPPTSQSVVDEQLVSSHVRSLQPGHLTDVQTTNQHIVKPWFNGRITFSPPVPELADVGFPLIGGRLDSIDGRTVPALVYKRRLHTVNVFVWPESNSGEHSFTKDGFSVREWSSNGLRFAAVSDIPAAELGQFEQQFKQRAG